MTPRFPKRLCDRLRTTNRAGAIGGDRSRASLVEAHPPTVADRVGDGRVRSFNVACERRAILSLDHLDGGGALSGGSRWSNAIAAPPANALPKMWPSPVTRLAATIWSANHLPRCVPRSSYRTPFPLDDE